MIKNIIVTVLLSIFITGISFSQTADEFKKQGEASFSEGKYVDAYKAYDQAVQLDNSDAVAYHQRGTALMLMQEFDEAIKDFNTAKQLSIEKFGKDAVTTAMSSLYVGLCKYYQKKYEDVLVAIDEQTISNLPLANRFEAYFTRGSAFYMVDNYTQAIHELTQSLKYDPENVEAWKLKAECNIRSGNMNEALTDLNNAISINSNYAQLYSTRGKVCFVLNNYTEAERDFSKAVELAPDQPQYYFELSGMKIQKEEYQDAIILLDKCIELAPDFSTAYYLRGKCKQYIFRDPCEDVKKAKELGDPDADAFIQANCR